MSSTVDRMVALRPLYDDARRRALAARVPDGDRDGPGQDLVTVSGWYHAPTISGRDAWVRYQWINGRCRQGECTYDLDGEMHWDSVSAEYGQLDWMASKDPELRAEAIARGVAL